ncbi:uncharacterized protein FIBRA_07994 [Fibroporia radiculosa]|uniref:Uncharacterized protein n=1 Tax=Fibroporia radiculosa TaxID=599839 RepID=J4IC43_9APHY|nr:uncharacterized protein FIBRA_07994 [Fibroporia radiculosa]CCM05761.1 predicted protein [Fibroporia radiculosa]
MSSSSDSSSPEPELVTKKSKKPSSKAAGKKKQLPHGQNNEGDSDADSDWAYQPPPGFVCINHAGDNGEFDWDAVKDDDGLELWLVRVPGGLKPKALHGLKIDGPAAAADARTARVGTVDRRHASYDVWALGDGDSVGGEELRGLSCLLPRKKEGGRLVQAPRPVARHLVITTQAASPTPVVAQDTSAPLAVAFQNPPRHSYPPELLKHRFMPSGSLVSTVDSPESVDVDQVDAMLEASQTEESPARQPAPVSKKRKSDKEHTKKSKKSRAAA